MPETMRDIFLNAGKRFSGRSAIRAAGHSRSYGVLLERAVRLTNVLLDSGLTSGDRVAAMLEDRLESLEVHLAAAIGGLTLVPINHRFVPREVDFVLEHSGARALVHTSGLTEVLSACGALTEVRPILMIGEGECVQGGHHYEHALGAASSRIPLVKVCEDDIALIGYTSGTTGFPKGAMISHRAQIAGIRNQAITYRLPLYSRLSFSGSLSFVALLNSFIYPHLFVGGCVDFVNSADVDRWIDQIAETRAHVTYLPTPLFPEFTEQAGRRSSAVSSLETVVHSASKAPVQQVEALVDVIGDRFVEAYGMTEIQVAATATTKDDVRGDISREVLYKTIGRATPSARVWAIGGDGQRLDFGERGELAIETDTAFSGYWQQPDKTAEALVDGVYRTGDIGYVDERGYVFLEGGRRSEMIVSGGMNVYPIEIEMILIEHPSVAECAVFSIPDERWGEAVAAAVVASHATSIDLERVIEFLRVRLASYKVPKQIFVVDELPRTTSLKVKKHALRSILGFHDPEE